MTIRGRRPSTTHAETVADRTGRARALGWFFAAGALLSTVVLLLPGWEQVHTAGIAVTVGLAASGSALIHAFAGRLARPVIHAFTASGTVLIGACQVLAGGGSPTAMYAMLYIWVILHAALFFPPPVVAGHLALTTVAHAFALVWLGDVASIAPQLALTAGTQIAAALVVGSLAERQRELADTDPLTGLANRRVVERTLAWAIARCERAASASVRIAVLDLDGFKSFNDARGHAAGDRLLADVAAAWRTEVRRSDTLARVGGDEFVLVLVDRDLATAERIVGRMIDVVPEGVACSAGLAGWRPTESPGELLERADQALYAAKAAGPIVLAGS